MILGNGLLIQSGKRSKLIPAPLESLRQPKPKLVIRAIRRNIVIAGGEGISIRAAPTNTNNTTFKQLCITHKILADLHNSRGLTKKAEPTRTADSARNRRYRFT